MAKEFSYEYQNVVRDLSDAFTQIIQKTPVLRLMIRNGAEATATKHEWLEDVVSPRAWTVNATRLIAGGTLVLVSTTGVKVGDILGFTDSTGSSKTVQLKVAAVVNTTDLTVTVYGGSTDVQLDATDPVRLVARPKNESTDAVADDGYEPTTEFNYTQIFDRTAKISKTSLEIKKYGIGRALDYQVARQLKDLAYELNSSIIHGSRVARSTTEAGTFGGVLWFLQQATGNKVDAALAPVSATILNDAFELGHLNGATNMSTLMCNINQARKISAFNVSGNNPVVTADETKAGSFVRQFVSDIPVAGGLLTTIIVDTNFPKDKIALLDLDKIALIPLQNRQFSDEDATIPGADSQSRRILGEFTLEVKNAGDSHLLIENLAL